MLALKGGNALRLVHGITSRTSVDLDFSIKQDFPNFSHPVNQEITQRQYRITN